jgi:hypothetical protein
MAKTERKYKGSLTLGKLELVLEAQEALYGTLVKLEALGGQTVGTYDDEDYPPLSSLALLPTIGGTAPRTKDLLLNGSATILGQAVDISVFRTD